MSSRLLVFAGLAVFLVAIEACSKEQPAEEPTATTVVEASPTRGSGAIPPLPTMTPTAGGRLDKLPATTLLIDVDRGKAVTLYRDPEQYASPGGWFDEDGWTVWYSAFENGRPVWVRVALDGTEISREHDSDTFLPWNPTQGGCEVDGRFYAGAACGAISPNRRWMAYVPREEPVTGPGYEIWSLDLQTDERRLLQGGLERCTQCDASGRLEWSDSGDFLMVKDTSNTFHLYVIDVPAGISRPIVTGGEERIPEWSPTEDLLARGESGATILEDVRTGAVREAAVSWPARFEPSGTYLYSVGDDFDTTIAEVASGALFAKLPGVAGSDANQRFNLLPPFSQPMANTSVGLLSALGPTPDCKGAPRSTGAPCRQIASLAPVRRSSHQTTDRW